MENLKTALNSVTQLTTLRHRPENVNLQQHRSKNTKSLNSRRYLMMNIMRIINNQHVR